MRVIARYRMSPRPILAMKGESVSKKGKTKPSAVVHFVNPRTQETKTGGPEFKASRSYLEEPCLQNKQIAGRWWHMPVIPADPVSNTVGEDKRLKVSLDLHPGHCRSHTH